MFHPGEHDVRRRTGIDAPERGSAGVGADVPEIAGEFLARQELIVLSANASYSLWTTVLTGPPGFLRAGDGRLHVAARPDGVDPLAGAFDTGTSVGMVALEPQSRRRMRLNGTARATPEGLEVDLEQVFANCPKYIQTRHREPSAVARPERIPAGSAGSTSLDAHQIRWVREADTFFVGTLAPGLGVDSSHRGGDPGFVEADERSISWPDYRGNTMYMTLGNLALDTRAALLFIDWESGDTLHVRGRASVDWDEARAARHPGAERMVDLAVEEVVEIRRHIPLRWRLDELSRFNPR